MRKHRFFWQNNSIIWKYILALLAGILVGFKVIPVPAVAFGFIALCGFALMRAAQGNLTGFLILLPFAIYTEIYIRAFARWVPYLSVQYLMIISFALLFIRGIKNNKTHFQGYIIFALFMLLELLNNLSPDRKEIGRAIFINTLSLLVVIYWASVNILKPIAINKFLSSIKIAAIYLAGIVLVAHLQGKINYTSVSNSDASNGMAPVQLSGYLGTACALFFLSIMNPEEGRTRWLNILCLAFAATIMVLTFSRGGIYFLGSTIGLFLFYNRHQWANYFKFVFLVPIVFIIYTFVVNQTEGKIVERYNQEGSSNRDVLVNIGMELYLRNPVFGVGTGNYNTQIVKQKLFYEESGAHNEFIRAAAEHGIFGIVLYWGFFIALFLNITKRRQPQQQFAMYFFVLFCLITIHNGLKISIQPMLLMMAVGITSAAYQKKNKLVIKELPEHSLA